MSIAPELAADDAATVLACPLRLPCGAVLSNRIAKAALSEQLSDRHNRATPAIVKLYERWGRSGAGLLLTGNVMVDPRALEEPRNVVLEDERDILTLARWADAAQAHGAACWVQISHPGRQTMRTLSRKPVAPSAVKMKFGRGMYAKPRALTEAEIEEIIARFARTAAISKSAGFAGVQLHAAHGYLISAFLSPLTNRREDGWGGSPEKRRRFMVEILRATRAAVGPSFPIGIKLNSADFQRGGFSEEESLATLAHLEAEGIDLVEISGGSYENTVMMGTGAVRESTRQREAYFHSYAEMARAVTKVPLMLTGGFRSPEGMVDAVASEAVDMVGLGRPMCVQPELPARLLDGTTEPLVLPPKRVGVRELDAILEVFWYTHQLHRMARGREPDLRRGRWRTLIAAQWSVLSDSLRMKFRRERR